MPVRTYIRYIIDKNEFVDAAREVLKIINAYASAFPGAGEDLGTVAAGMERLVEDIKNRRVSNPQELDSLYADTLGAVSAAIDRL
ncbi:MAG: hypothetical protein JW838_06140 [Spirochaetes bacterium]|nr:hypothetical protein [Spirochaetota bacterium]